jgi:hypothetical protein
MSKWPNWDDGDMQEGKEEFGSDGKLHPAGPKMTWGYDLICVCGRSQVFPNKKASVWELAGWRKVRGYWLCAVCNGIANTWKRKRK